MTTCVFQHLRMLEAVPASLVRHTPLLACVFLVCEALCNAVQLNRCPPLLLSEVASGLQASVLLAIDAAAVLLPVPLALEVCRRGAAGAVKHPQLLAHTQCVLPTCSSVSASCRSRHACLAV
jgi:hypothetical protein